MSHDNTLTKTVRQYSRPMPQETMEFLKGIAADYGKVRNYVYGKYAGIKSFARLASVYDILNEMRHCGLREQLNLPSVYYELAIMDAVADIKSGWGIVKGKISEQITANEALSSDDRLYLRTVLKIGSVYAAVLNRQEYEMPEKASGLTIDTKRLNNLLCRLTRKYMTMPKTGDTDWFRISPNGYSYRDGGMRIVGRTPRKRVFIPLKDNRTFDRQILVKLETDSVVLSVPIEAKIKKHPDYVNTVCVYIGNKNMFTLADGKIYGEHLDALVDPETERLTRKNLERHRMYWAYEKNVKAENSQKAANIEANNLGRQKYRKQKETQRRRTTDWINSEINRMLREEKPARIVATKPVTKNRKKLGSKAANRKLARSFQGYIRERLSYKCNIHSIELLEISAKGTGMVCSACGAEGKRQGTEFICESCGYQAQSDLNIARNIRKKVIAQENPGS